MQEDIDKWLKELKKGSTKLSILSLLRSGDKYGYELIHELEVRTAGVIVIKESNAYPALHSMESDGLVGGYWKETGEGIPPEILPHHGEGAGLPRRDDPGVETLRKRHERSLG